MTGNEWLDGMPEHPGQERDEYVYQAAVDCVLNYSWFPIKSEARGHHLEIMVSSDALYVELDDGSRYRPMTCASLIDKLASLANALPCTSYVCDLAYQQATVPLRAHPLNISHLGAEMENKKWSIHYNEFVEKERAGRDGLVRDCGKTFVLSKLALQRHPKCGVNYGFFDHQAPYLSHSGSRLWQSRGSRHEASYSDYSQICILMKNECLLDGEPADLKSILSNSSLTELVSDEGPFTWFELH